MINKVNSMCPFIFLGFLLVFSLSGCTNSAEQEEIDRVEVLISKIDIEDPDISIVEEARFAYDALLEASQEKVSNYNILTESEKQMHIEQDELYQSTYDLILANISKCEALQTAIIVTWGNAIQYRYADFNEALASLQAFKKYEPNGKTIVSQELAAEFRKTLLSAENNHATIETNMQELARLDLGSNVYEALLDLYSEYVVFYNQIESPSGSYATYSSDTNDSLSNISKAQSLLDIVWPY